MRLIDADSLMDEIAVLLERNEKLIDGWLANIIDDTIEQAPIIDAVPVVRCKDCKHWICNPNTEEWGKCKWISDEQFDVVMNADDYCSYGERKDAPIPHDDYVKTENGYLEKIRSHDPHKDLFGDEQQTENGEEAEK